MPTIKLELFKSKTLIDGRHPVYIRVNHGKPARKAIASAFPSEYKGKPDKCFKGNTGAILKKNREIELEFEKYENVFKDFVRSGINWKPEDVFAVTDQVPVEIKKTFNEIAELYIGTLTGYTKSTYTGAINKFKTFVNNDGLLLSEINSKIIDGYIFNLRNVIQRNGKTNEESTIKTSLRIIRFVSTFGAKHKHDTKPDDLHNFKLPIAGQPNTDFLTQEELVKFANVHLPDKSVIKEIQQAFLLAVYLRGMRIGDIILLKQAYFVNGRLKYMTGKNSRDMDMELLPKASSIVAELLDGREYLFRFYKFFYDPLQTKEQNDYNRTSHIKCITANINSKLKIIASRAGINKNVRSHIARHSFTNIMDSKNTDISVIQALLGHASRAMTERYIKKIRKSDVLDAAVKNVFGD